jgi:uncharacterized membrane protein YwzB
MPRTWGSAMTGTEHTMQAKGGNERFALSLTAGIVVAAITIAVAWWINGMNKVRFEQFRTRGYLRSLGREIESYRDREGHLPDSLDELGQPLEDFWGHPIEYTVDADGDNYVLRSFGQDGEPGGVGVDCDLTQLEPYPPNCEPTPGQILANRGVRGMASTGLVAGLFVFALSYVYATPRRLAPDTQGRTMSVIVTTILGATIVATYLAAIHLATGH